MIPGALLNFFNLFCLVHGAFFVLYYIIKFLVRGGTASTYFIILNLLALTWGIYSVIGVNS